MPGEAALFAHLSTAAAAAAAAAAGAGRNFIHPVPSDPASATCHSPPPPAAAAGCDSMNKTVSWKHCLPAVKIEHLVRTSHTQGVTALYRD